MQFWFCFDQSGNMAKSASTMTKVESLEEEITRLEAEYGDLVFMLKLSTMSETDLVRRKDDLDRLLKLEEQEIQEIRAERDQARKDKKNVESAYADYQEKYERLLKTVFALKDKEDLLLERDNELVEKVRQLDADLEKFKENATRQVESEYEDWMGRLAEAEATNMRLRMMIRKAEMKVEKLEHDLGQKDKENNELHNLCDDLIQSSSRKSSRQDDTLF